ncbi:MAG: hypothetical protein M4579_005754 [Chaenotheca gracillima]|nr:MAG: hypothetical protein M4579_005754 [Chaenotheca gracillima]
MPADNDRAFYKLLDSAAVTTGDEDAVSQNKRIKEAEFAEDSREPNAQEEKALKQYVEETRHPRPGPVDSKTEKTSGRTESENDT